jgi:hypothetical protein
VLRRIVCACALLAVVLILAGCQADKPLPADPKALEADLTTRGLALRETLPVLGLEGQASVESLDGKKLAGRWKLIAVRGKGVELTVTSSFFNETVARLTATPETLRIWLKPPGKREARIYEGPRQSLPAALEAAPWARELVPLLTGGMDAWPLSGVRDAGAALVLDFQRPQGTAHLQIRRRDGFPLLLETRPAADPSLGCLSVNISPERPLVLETPALRVPQEVRGEVRSCCTGKAVMSWRLRVSRAWTQVDPLPSLEQDGPKPRPLSELSEHEWFRRAGPLVSAHQTHLSCPAAGAAPQP